MSENRYAKQEIFEGLGKAGQEKLKSSSVVIAGCGALGNASSSLLVRAGLGRVRVIDRDQVEMENLHRQLLFNEAHARQSYPKALAAAEMLRTFNSEVKVEAEVAEINENTVGKLLGGFDLVLDALDSIETRLVVNDFCVRNKTPWIYAAAVGSTGTVMNIAPGGKPCLRCLVPELPEPGTYPTCDTAGILGPSPVTSASVQVSEALKVLAGSSEVSYDLLIFDLYSRSFDRVCVQSRKDCTACA